MPPLKFPKPARGSYALELIERKAKVKQRIERRRKEVRLAPGPTAQRRAVKARSIVDKEQLVKEEVKRLDGYRCRWPECRDNDFIGERYSGWAAVIDACHYQAEGMGGDPTLERCTPENLVSLHRWHHEQLHLGLARMRPLDEALGMRGPVEFSAAVPGEAGKFFIVGVTEPPKEQA